MARRAGDFVETFIQYGMTYNTTPLFLRWAAHWMLGTAVGRACGMKSFGNFLAPNFFLLLIAGPGAGKSQCINAVNSVYRLATDFKIIPASVTRAGMEDYMQANLQTRRTPTGEMAPTNECIGMSEELQGILPEHDIGHLTLYNELYDNKEVHKAVTRTHGEIRLERPYCSILTGAQPAFLAQGMPEQAWGMGFMSRSVMVFDVVRERRSMFDTAEVDQKLRTALIQDIKDVRKLYGYFHWEDAAKRLYERWWVEKGGEPVPTAKRLAMGYNARRPMQFAKLAMTHSLARTNELVVTEEDCANAIRLLLETEEKMKHVFTEMSNTGAMVAIQDMLDAIKHRCSGGGVMPESDLVQMMLQRFQPTQVHSLLDNLLKTEMLEIVGSITAPGLRKFKPGKKMPV